MISGHVETTDPTSRLRMRAPIVLVPLPMIPVPLDTSRQALFDYITQKVTIHSYVELDRTSWTVQLIVYRKMSHIICNPLIVAEVPKTYC